MPERNTERNTECNTERNTECNTERPKDDSYCGV